MCEVFPLPARVSSFRAALEEWVKKRQGQGLDTSLSRQLFAPEGATFVITTRFRDLAEFEIVTHQIEDSVPGVVVSWEDRRVGR